VIGTNTTKAVAEKAEKPFVQLNTSLAEMTKDCLLPSQNTKSLFEIIYLGVLDS